MSTDTDRLEREAEEHRSNLDSTFDAIRDRLSVGQIVDELSGYVREGAGAETVQNFGRQVRDNPLALGLVGAGLAWLAFGSGVRSRGADYVDTLRHRNDDERRYGYGTRIGEADERTYPVARTGTATTVQSHETASTSGPGVGTRLSSAARSAGETGSHAASSASSSVRDAASSAGSSISGAASSAGSSISGAASSVGSSARNAAASTRDAASRGMQSASDALSSAGESARRGLHDARDSFGNAAEAGYDRAYEAGRSVYRSGARAGRTVADFMRDEPLVFGAIAIAVGAAIGAALPPTRREDEWMGETRDNLRDEAYSRGRDTLDRAGSVATRAYEAASDEAENKGLKPAAEGSGSETLAKKVGDIGRAAEAAAKDEANKQNLT